MKIDPITLQGSFVTLVPLTQAHSRDIADLLDPTLTQYFPRPFRSIDDAQVMIDEALNAQAAGSALPFTTIDNASGKIVGGTRFANIRTTDRVVEIGFTFIGRKFQRTAANTEAKLMMLRHAFQCWSVNRVEFKTDSLNLQSRAALRRLGAVEEGTFRNHMVMETGRLRHSVWYSITPDDWPGIHARLQARLVGAQAKSG